MTIEQFVREFIAEHGYSPTVRDIQAGCHMSSTSDVWYHLQRLKKQGVLTFEPGKARTIRLKEA